MKRFLPISLLLLACLPVPVAVAEERTLTHEQMEALANTGDFTGEEEIVRPKNLPDLTKGGTLPTGKAAPPVWTLGPTGIVGQMAGREKGDQVLVHGTVKSSPSEGKLLPGDVIIGMHGRQFVAGFRNVNYCSPACETEVHSQIQLALAPLCRVGGVLPVPICILIRSDWDVEDLLLGTRTGNLPKQSLKSLHAFLHLFQP